MKTKLLTILVVLPIFLLTTSGFAQTTLAVGDIAILELKGDDPDNFAFVTFVDIAAGTGIYFTDCGANASGFRMPACTEGARKYTVPAGGLDAGDIVKYNSGGNSDFAGYTDTRITGSNFLFAGSGDQVLAFQDATSAAGGTNAANNPTFLYILHGASTQFAGDPADSNESSLPPGLNDTTPPRSALALGAGPGVDNEYDNVIYNGTYDFSGFATTAEAITAAKLAITDPGNYLQDNTATSGPYTTAVGNIPNELNLMTLSNDEFLSNSFAVYPNPSNGNITIRNSGIALQNVTITDLNGRTMGSYEMNGTTSNADLSLNLNTGMYFMKLTSNDASTTKKLIIK